jgi:hypothetical protein
MARESLPVFEKVKLREGDRVVTPRDEVGFIRRVNEEGFALGQYAGALSSESSEFTLDERLLVLWKPETPRPKPYRAADAVGKEGAR